MSTPPAADAGGEEGGGCGSLARLQEELRGEQQRVLVWENEAMQLRARVAALERANQVCRVGTLWIWFPIAEGRCISPMRVRQNTPAGVRSTAVGIGCCAAAWIAIHPLG